jgi:hypothetical protein
VRHDDDVHVDDVVRPSLGGERTHLVSVNLGEGNELTATQEPPQLRLSRGATHLRDSPHPPEVAFPSTWRCRSWCSGEPILDNDIGGDTIQGDGRTVSGTYTCNAGGTRPWRGVISSE